jgi:hypothetical protein
VLINHVLFCQKTGILNQNSKWFFNLTKKQMKLCGYGAEKLECGSFNDFALVFFAQSLCTLWLIIALQKIFNHFCRYFLLKI